VSDQTVGNVLRRFGIPPEARGPPGRISFPLTVAVLTGVDFFTVEVAHLTGLGYLLRALLHPTGDTPDHAGRITRHRTAEWMLQVSRSATDGESVISMANGICVTTATQNSALAFAMASGRTEVILLSAGAMLTCQFQF
jgi:hypothetical protein